MESRIRGVLVSLAGVIALVVALPHAAAAQSATERLDRARELYLAADFRGAQTEFGEVLKDPTLGRTSAAEAYRYLAVVSMVLGDEPRARIELRSAMLLDPKGDLPPGAPPGLVSTLADLRREIGDRELGVDIVSADTTKKSNRVRADVVPERISLVTKVHLQCTAAGDVPHDQTSAPPVELVVGDHAAVDCTADALTEGGAVVAHAQKRVPLAVVSIVGADAAGTTNDDDDGGSSAWLWVGIGAGVAAVAAGVVLIAVATSSSTSGSPRSDSTIVNGWQ